MFLLYVYGKIICIAEEVSKVWRARYKSFSGWKVLEGGPYQNIFQVTKYLTSFDSESLNESKVTFTQIIINV